MSCEEIRGALPLLDADSAQAEAVRAHLAVCAACEELAAGYDADAASLGELRSLFEAEQPAVLAGFADAVMAAVAVAPREEESRAAPAAVAPILRPSFGPMLWMAAAAAFLIALGLGMSATPNAERPTSGERVTASAGDGTAASAPSAPVVKVSLPSAASVPAPKRVVRPRLMRGNRNVMPVDSDGARGVRGNNWMNAIERLWGRGERQVPPVRPGEREVRF